MTGINEIISQRGNGIMVVLSADDLQDLLDSAVDRAKSELLPQLVRNAEEDLLTKKQVMKKFKVCDTTLWHWRNNGYLEAVKLGRKVLYRRKDVERVIRERRTGSQF